jgi:hypothetical protein
MYIFPLECFDNFFQRVNKVYRGLDLPLAAHIRQECHTFKRFVFKGFLKACNQNCKSQQVAGIT